MGQGSSGSVPIEVSREEGCFREQIIFTLDVIYILIFAFRFNLI